MSRGGYRVGAGRRGWRPLLEACERVDVRSYAWLSPECSSVQVGEQTVNLAWLQCGFGGKQPYFVCPRCSHRRRSLYRRPLARQFGCRGCLGLAYNIECETRIARVQRQHRKFLARLGPHASKPRGMRWATFWRIRNHVDALELEFDELLLLGFAQLRKGQ